MLFLGTFALGRAQNITLSGTVTDQKNGKPVEFASILLKESGLWAVSDAKGKFTVKNIPQGKATLMVRCLGYATHQITVLVNGKTPTLQIQLQEDNLKLNEVEVVASKKNDEATTSYTIDRLALDNQQVVNISDIVSLLPGGKTVNSSLTSNRRIALRSEEKGEKGNTSFGTAVEVDGVRLNNNSVMGETLGPGTRTVGTSNVESVEIVTGVPSVEYGDLSNGVVKVNTRKGKSPFIVEGKLNINTRQIALNKGFDLGRNGGLFNFSIEHARSFSDVVSPYTAYQRNVLSLHYMNVFMRNAMPLTLNVGLTGNIGGYNSKADPDQDLDDYDKVRDNAFRGNFSLEWLLNKKWITNITLQGSLAYTDKRTERYYNTSSSSTQAYIHTMKQGYFVAADYDNNPSANIILGPTGYWYVRGFNDSKPLSYALKLKVDWTKRMGQVLNKVLAGADFTGSTNYGQGSYYEDRRYTPTWRPYRYDELPAMNNLALYIEEKASIPTSHLSTLEITAGLRQDMTLIGGSEYGTAASTSPRAKARYIFWRGRNTWIRDFSVHAGWGKSVKLPSFQVLYPATTYRDQLAFTPGSTSKNKAYYAYYTHPSRAVYNPDLLWQYTNQTDIGLETKIKGTRINVSAFYHKTFNPYTATTVYTPYSYKYTSQAALERIGIPSANRSYSIDQQTGVVTVTDVTGAQPPVELAYSVRNSFLTNTKYVNGSPTERYGFEWIVDFAPIKALRTSLRLDGNYYFYKGLDENLFAHAPLNQRMSNGQPYQYIGYYRGSDVTSTDYAAGASVFNGSISREANLNATVTTHVPKIRMVVSLRVECSLYAYSRPLSELRNGTRGYVVERGEDFFGRPYTRDARDKFLVVYPEYYATWDAPETLIPFAEKFAWAKKHDRTLYNELAKLVQRSNYAYVINPGQLSSYYSANITATKEIGDHVSVSFYANNFWNTMAKVHSTQTGQKTSLFGSSYVPSFYYGLSLRLKL